MLTFYALEIRVSAFCRLFRFNKRFLLQCQSGPIGQNGVTVQRHAILVFELVAKLVKKSTGVSIYPRLRIGTLQETDLKSEPFSQTQ